jgi:hypothetical protein
MSKTKENQIRGSNKENVTLCLVVLSLTFNIRILFLPKNKNQNSNQAISSLTRVHDKLRYFLHVN